MSTTRGMAVLAAACLLAAGCGGATEERPAQGGGTFTYGLNADPGALDPGMATLSVTNTVLSLAYDTLTAADANGKIVPVLAEKWDVKPDSVTFTLRKGVTCSDGSPLTADDVAASISFITDPKNKSPLNGVFVPPGLTAKADAAAGTVTLSTPKPFSFILESTRDVFIVCGKGLKDRSLLAKGTSGSGPYRLVEAAPGDHYTFQVRKDYTWGPNGATTSEPGQPDKVVFRIVPNEQTAANLLISGGINATIINGVDRTRVEAAPGVKGKVLPGGNGQFFYHQGKDRPTRDPQVRKALTQALNLTELAGIASGGTGRPATTLVLKPSPCPGDSVAGHVPGYDPAAAAAALDAAGWKPGPDGIRVKDGKKLTLRLLYSTTRSASVQAAAEYLAAEWRKLGVDVKLNGVIDTKVSESLMVTQDWDVTWLPIGVNLPSQLLGFLSGPGAPEGGNFAHLKNGRYEKLVAEAGTKPGPEGCKLWLEAESALFESADLIPVVENTQLLAMKGATLEVLAGNFRGATIRLTEGG
ncbi:ABC transporter substrate-binding protein [Thermopolyspora sp. NPDC052614]|uniref:ABC transporter substrate-binding protein n=1 Tax=Thermopolyspora sp. NPDC052614 TaxID=3155682 RepID=UPI003421C333